MEKRSAIEEKPLASISLDLDNQWAFMKTHGDTEWKKLPSYLEKVVPIILDTLDHLDLKITFFIVGQDAALEKNKEALKLLTHRGHEVANHSYHHDTWLQEYPKDKIRTEILDAEDHIFKISGQKAVGFRGPGFVWSPKVFEVLAENGYVYDASTLPTYLGLLARAYFFRTSNLTADEKLRHKKLFGAFKDGIRPVKPYWWELDSGKTLLEIPVTTIPIVKTPFHLSYLIYLSRFSESLMIFYINTAIALCKITATKPSFLLHPLDFLSTEEVPQLGFFPAMDLKREKKLEIFDKVIRMLSRHFRLVNMSTHAESLLVDDGLRKFRV
ncbi:MAG: polysaccharide deacetylase family protein [Planctomycetota bacterium]|jgi:peptidoglycan/xylan/chitin deacetylase (PgdA/CDA1 family)